MLRVERPDDTAAENAIGDASDMAVGQRGIGGPGRRPGRAGGTGGDERRGGEASAARRHSPSVRFNSPLAIRASASSQPPTSVPLTKTIGNVGQPVHIFSELRFRHSLK